MISYYNDIDSSYFEITSKDLKSKDIRILTDQVITFSLTEENKRMLTGAITFKDDNHILSRILRHGMKLNISFGYRKFQEPLLTSFIKKENPNEMFMPGNLRRENIQATVQSPSGTMSENGDVVFNCNFYGYEYMLNERKIKSYAKGTKGDIIREVFLDMGINSFSINFRRQSELVSPNRQVYQREGNFKFLYRMSREWGCCFRIGYNKSGQLFGLFIDYSKIGDPFYSTQMTGAVTGSSIQLDWREGARNVISASWKNNQGVNGGGDNVQIRYGANGEPVYERFVTSGDSVVVWRLNPNRIKNELVNLPLKERTAKLGEFLNAQNFEEVKKYFDPVTETTAPEGLGYELDVNMIGNPLLSSPIQVEFGGAFPDFLVNKTTKYYCNKVTHKIDRSGYKSDLQIADAFTITGGSLI